MAKFKDYYKILGVDRNADQKTISQAYRRLARLHHPDVNRGDKRSEEKFKEINEAYQVLGDPQKRARYDQMYDYYTRGGVDWQEVFRQSGTYRTPSGGWTIFGDLGDLFEGPGGFSEFFQEFFGDLGGPFRTAQGRGQAMDAQLEISLEEAFRGTTRRLEVRTNGRVSSLEVSIPPGVNDGDRIRIPGRGPGGDLYVTVRIKPHPLFERREDDLFVEIPVSLAEAVLGAEIEVPTLAGKVTMRLPPETQNGQVFRLKGLGMPRKGGGRGDELVKVKVVLPTKLSAQDRESLAEALRRLHQENPRAPLGCR